MATKLRTTYVDDLDGTEAEAGGIETVKFAVNNVGYEIDLTPVNAERFRKEIGRYTEVARRATMTLGVRTATGHGSNSRSSVDRRQSNEIRAWAKQRGLNISDRGRVPASIVAEFNHSKVNGNGPAPAPAARELLDHAAAPSPAPETAPEPATVKSGPAKAAAARAGKAKTAAVTEANGTATAPAAKRGGRTTAPTGKTAGKASAAKGSGKAATPAKPTRQPCQCAPDCTAFLPPSRVARGDKYAQGHSPNARVKVSVSL